METEKKVSNFITNIIDEDLKTGKHKKVVTRFPPEPNGYLHIGHSKSICLNFGIAEDYNGITNLRFDDTNPSKEELEYVEAIKKDIKWLGFNWEERLYFASDYFEKLYNFAETLIEKGLAYVCDLTAEETKDYRGTFTEPGKNSPYRNRSVEENLDLFRRMRAGEFAEGARILRAKIDMASPNLNMRDPALYRILKEQHHRTGNKWLIYPMYDYTHAVSDALEGITHSICSLEFEDHRPLYDWCLEALNWPKPRPQQIEFARMNLEYTVMSKRKLLKLVEAGYVDSWDDPRLPTLSALRRRGVTAASIKLLCERIGVAKRNSWIEYEWLEKAIRDDLNATTPRVMAVLNPLKVVIDNWPADKVEEIEAPLFPDEPDKMGSRKLYFTKELYIEKDDFMLKPPKKFYRLAVGREVRLRWAFYIVCNDVICNDKGEPIEIRCSYYNETQGLAANPKRPAIIHWVPKEKAIKATVNLYDRLFKVPYPEGNPEDLNPNSLVVMENAQLEPYLAEIEMGERVQFERLGFFTPDAVLYKKDAPVFNRIVTLRDSWTKHKK